MVYECGHKAYFLASLGWDAQAVRIRSRAWASRSVASINPAWVASSMAA
jgi:hypothetical protein